MCSPGWSTHFPWLYPTSASRTLTSCSLEEQSGGSTPHAPLQHLRSFRAPLFVRDAVNIQTGENPEHARASCRNAGRMLNASQHQKGVHEVHRKEGAAPPPLQQRTEHVTTLGGET